MEIGKDQPIQFKLAKTNIWPILGWEKYEE